MSTAPTPTPVPSTALRMSHRQILEALSGLLLGLFVTMLSATVVSAALPKIIHDLGAGQTAYTWVVTATLLATTVSTPIWGKLADLLDRKLLTQLSLIVFVVGSAAAGLSQSAGMLITFRVVQGLGAGGMTALAVVVMADIISPRERGRYMGYMGAVMAVSTVAGPLLGGVITDTSWLGWRWCFYVGAPVAGLALVVLQKTLRLPPRPHRVVRIDYAGATLISAGVSLLLIWVSLAGHQFAWRSWQTAAMLAGGAALLGVAGAVEARAAEPIIPLKLLRHRTVVLAIVASVAVGIALFGTTVFLSQYMQIARDKCATLAGVLSIPMTIGTLGSSTIVGRLISRTGRYKRWMLTGGVLLPAGLALMGTIHYDTPMALLAVYMFVVGLGVGMLMQNLVLAVQNVVPVRELGAASSNVAFFRSMGGAIGVSALGAVVGTHITTLLPARLAAAGVPASGGRSGGQLPDLHTLPVQVRIAVQSSYADSIAHAFLIAAPIAVVALLAVVFLREAPLRTSTAAEELSAQAVTPADPQPAAADTDAQLVMHRAAEERQIAGTGPSADNAVAA